MNKWFTDRDGTYALLVDPESTLTNNFKFNLGKDASCAAITISSISTSTSGPISVVTETLTGNTVSLQTKGCGDVLIILNLSSGDIRRPVRRYIESNKSLTF